LLIECLLLFYYNLCAARHGLIRKYHLGNPSCVILLCARVDYTVVKKEKKKKKGRWANLQQRKRKGKMQNENKTEDRLFRQGKLKRVGE